MRFSFAHKLSTYLMVGCAYLALILSGELSDITVILSAIGIAVSWAWESPRVKFERWSRAWTVVSALMFVYSAVAIAIGGDFLLIGAQFLLYLLTAKLFNRRACKDYQHVYILTFLMLVSGTVLNTEFTYGVFFLGYVVSATWALILFHLRREMEDNFLLKHSDDVSSERVQVARILNSRRIVGQRFFVGTSLVSVSIFAAASVLFLLIPRIGFGLFFNKSRSGITMAGFSDGVQLGGHGVIKDDDTIVMRIDVDSRYEGRRAPYIHWRGVAFDYYSNGEWRRSRHAPVTNRQVVMSRGVTRHHLLYEHKSANFRELTGTLAGTMRQEIYLEPLGYDVLFGASMPSAFEFETRWRERARQERNDEIRHPHTAGIKYVVYSNIDSPEADVLRAASTELPAGYDAYLQIPPEVTARVRDLARDITAGQSTAYDKAVAIESWLERNLTYTRQMESPRGSEPIDFFVFSRKRGHCEYFSSAMAIMLRSVGVPARNVNGFLGGEWNEYDEYIAVRAGDAHSWVEAFFPGVGWVTFDPTPAAVVDQLGRGDGGVLARLGRFADTLRFKWFKWVIEYDLYRQLSLFRRIGEVLRGGAGGFLKRRATGARDWIREHKAIAAVLGSLLTAVAAAVWLWRRRRRADLGVPAFVSRRRSRHPIAHAYRAAATRLARRGHRREASTTPREHARALDRGGVPGARAFVELTEIYYAAEYGAQTSDDLVARARTLAGEVDHALRERNKKTG